METRANYILIGSFTLMASAGLLLFVLWAAKYSAERDWREYDVVFREPVTGLSEGSSVQYNGLSIGTVTHLMLAPDDPRAVIARLRLQASAPIRADTRARLSLPSLTGMPIIQLTGGHPELSPLDTHHAGEVPVIHTEASALQNIADTANLLVERLDRLLSEDNIARINQTLAHLERTTGMLAAREDDLDATIRSTRRIGQQLESTLSTAGQVMDGLDRHLIQRLPGLTGRLDHALVRLDSAASSADAILTDNRMAFQQFASDGLTQLGPTLGQLQELIGELSQISERLRVHPLRYLMGRDGPREFDPGEFAPQ